MVSGTSTESEYHGLVKDEWIMFVDIEQILRASD